MFSKIYKFLQMHISRFFKKNKLHIKINITFNVKKYLVSNGFNKFYLQINVIRFINNYMTYTPLLLVIIIFLRLLIVFGKVFLILLLYN